MCRRRTSHRRAPAQRIAQQPQPVPAKWQPATAAFAVWQHSPMAPLAMTAAPARRATIAWRQSAYRVWRWFATMAIRAPTMRAIPRNSAFSPTIRSLARTATLAPSAMLATVALPAGRQHRLRRPKRVHDRQLRCHCRVQACQQLAGLRRWQRVFQK